jgi:hypothetical protein
MYTISRAAKSGHRALRVEEVKSKDISESVRLGDRWKLSIAYDDKPGGYVLDVIRVLSGRVP